ncbi:MAG: pantetheine-phosphate adenylyltransferase [Candidatus Aenigmarchaeota archaeon]|nr:pantetheine-phosphate adenylyltransferase [Candidatus Aenigmarchaeota archaeon]NIP40532.1 pantetheine-phosphate adenylyltransferase [Candidatus Aenigmarchaeota archaeon]NIQ18377.1 pantetheine-phosphate adenylyltransferase [Candidatus Aenigmarchaeota archaeon]
MPYKYKKICFGGTFDIPIHKGHEALIEKAFEIGKFCVIGLTTEEYAAFLRKRDSDQIKPFRERKENLVRYLKSENLSGRFEIVELGNFCDPRLMEEETDVEAIIVSEEREWVAEEINKEREGNGFKPFDIVLVPIVLAEDRVKISSSRVRSGEITPEGKIKK